MPCLVLLDYSNHRSWVAEHVITNVLNQYSGDWMVRRCGDIIASEMGVKEMVLWNLQPKTLHTLHRYVSMLSHSINAFVS